MANYGLVIDGAGIDAAENHCCTLLIAAWDVSRIGCG